MGVPIDIENEVNEIWLPCVGYEDKYEVSNLGRVRSLPYTYVYKSTGRKKHCKGKIKSQCETAKANGHSGYMCTRLMDKNGVSTCRFVHLLVAKAFIPNPKNYPMVNHKDGNKHNNNVSNLEWVTYAENNQHAYDNGFKSDNQILIRTNNNNIINGIYVSINSASLKTGYGRHMITKYCNKHVPDDYGNYWYRYQDGVFVLENLNEEIKER